MDLDAVKRKISETIDSALQKFSGYSVDTIRRHFSIKGQEVFVYADGDCINIVPVDIFTGITISGEPVPNIAHILRFQQIVDSEDCTLTTYIHPGTNSIHSVRIYKDERIPEYTIQPVAPIEYINLEFKIAPH